jgi:hypothetical protein
VRNIAGACSIRNAIIVSRTYGSVFNRPLIIRATERQPERRVNIGSNILAAMRSVLVDHFYETFYMSEHLPLKLLYSVLCAMFVTLASSEDVLAADRALI